MNQSNPLFRVEIGFGNGQILNTDFTPETKETAIAGFLGLLATKAKLLANKTFMAHVAKKSLVLPKRKCALSFYVGSKLVKTSWLGLPMKTTFLQDIEAVKIAFDELVSEGVAALERAGSPDLIPEAKFQWANTQIDTKYIPLETLEKTAARLEAKRLAKLQIEDKDKGIPKKGRVKNSTEPVATEE